jgi:hypothetical protein
MQNHAMTTCIFCAQTTPDNRGFCQYCGKPVRATRQPAGSNQTGFSLTQAVQGLFKKPFMVKVFLPITVLCLLTAIIALVMLIAPGKTELQLPSVLCSADDQVQILVPVGWENDPGLYFEAQLQASDKERNLHIIVHSVSKATNFGLSSDLTLEKSSQTPPAFFAKDSCAEISAPIRLRIKNQPALQREIRALYLGQEVGCLQTVVETPTHFQEITAWTSLSLFEKNRPTFSRITESLDEFDANKKYAIDYTITLQEPGGGIFRTISLVTDKRSLNVKLRGTYTDTVYAGGMRAGFSLDVRSLPESIELNGFEFTITEKTIRAEDRSWVLQEGRYTTIDLDKITAKVSLNSAGADHKPTVR